MTLNFLVVDQAMGKAKQSMDKVLKVHVCISLYLINGCVSRWSSHNDFIVGFDSTMTNNLGVCVCEGIFVFVASPQ